MSGELTQGDLLLLYALIETRIAEAEEQNIKTPASIRIRDILSRMISERKKERGDEQ